MAGWRVAGPAGGLLLASALLLLGACAATPPPPAAAQPAAELFSTDTTRFGTPPPIPTPAELLRLTPAQESAFLAWMEDPVRSQVPAHQRVADYLHLVTRNFRYEAETLDASEALASLRGNCLTLAILTSSLAELAGVEVGYQLMDDNPVFEVLGSVVQKGVHVRSILIDPSWQPDPEQFYLFRPGIKIDYFPTGNERFLANIGKADFQAMYYRNRAAEAITAGRPGDAWWLALESRRYAPDHAEAINLLAVASRRTGDAARAEALYRYGIEQAEDKLSLLKNYEILLSEQGRHEEAGRVRGRLDTLQDPSPVHWYHLGRQAFAQSDFVNAQRYYLRAVQLAPYLHEGYLGMAQVAWQTGEARRAQQYLRQAAEIAPRASTRRLYQAKLNALTRQADGDAR